METVLLIILGMVFGIFITWAKFINCNAGMLLVKQDSEDGTPYLFLEIRTSVNTIIKKKYVLFEIDPKARLPRR